MNIFEMLNILGNGASASAVLKILTSNLGEINLETLFQSFIDGFMSYVQTLMSMLGITL
jgi:hypothetical protein